VFVAISLVFALSLDTATKYVTLPKPKPVPRIGIPRGEIPRDIGGPTEAQKAPPPPPHLITEKK
jgi:hypothetical protein